MIGFVQATLLALVHSNAIPRAANVQLGLCSMLRCISATLQPTVRPTMPRSWHLAVAHASVSTFTRKDYAACIFPFELIGLTRLSPESPEQTHPTSGPFSVSRSGYFRTNTMTSLYSRQELVEAEREYCNSTLVPQEKLARRASTGIRSRP